MKGRTVGEDDDIGVTIVRAVAEVKEVETEELPVLNDVIDPDALDGLFNNKSECVGQVAFTYADCYIVVTSDRRLMVSKLDEKSLPDTRADFFP